MFIDKKLYNKIYDILRTGFKTYECGDYMYFNQEDMTGMLEELVYEIKNLKEEYNELEGDMQENYRRIRPYEEIE